MKIIIFSDTHLTCKFERDKFEFLKNLIVNADKVVINGDFWEGYLILFDEFVKSKWNELFLLLRQKNTVYIYGNHDKKKWMNQNVFLFCDELVSRYKFRSGNKEFNVSHGDKIYISIGDKHPKLANKCTAFISMNIRNWGVKIMGWNFNEKFYWSSKKTHKVLMGWAKDHFCQNQYFVFSHSHFPEIKDEINFINLGHIGQNLASYVMIEDGRIKLIKEKY